MGILDLWRWAQENKEIKQPLTEGSNRHPQKKENTTTPPSPLCSSTEKKTLGELTSILRNEELRQTEERFKKIEERVDFLWKGSVEPRVIMLERQVDQLKDMLSLAAKTLNEYAEKMNTLYKSHNNLIETLDAMTKQFPYAFTDTYYLAERLEQVIIELKANGYELDKLEFQKH